MGLSEGLPNVPSDPAFRMPSMSELFKATDDDQCTARATQRRGIMPNVRLEG